MINLLAAKFAQIASQIDITTAQITALQAKLSELQEHQQQLLSVEQACTVKKSRLTAEPCNTYSEAESACHKGWGASHQLA